jgi:hypothetical protein
MKEYYVTKRHVDVDEDEGFFVEKILNDQRKDITSKIDASVQFEDDDDLVDFIAEVFNEDIDDILVIEEETRVEFSGDPGKLDADGAGMIQG